MESFLLTLNTYWSPSIATIMIVSNILTIVIGRYAIQVRGLGPSIPISSNLGGFGLPELLATMSLGHIVGVGTILGLTNMGILPY
uniref:Photosystem I reaction center subunit PsaK n=1 Tax=Sciadococcus taiwanensis TaxID=3028030 RepID=A0A9Y1I235_9RHOD|nr:photosystem I subunit X [Sciadococcus taiwanensis]